MQIKTFTGATAHEAMAQVKQEMGVDAVILSSRNVKRDGEVRHEITACLEQSAENAGTPAQGWDEWYKDWSKVREHLYALMQPSLQWERLAPRQRAALEYMQREEVDEALVMDLYHNMVASPAMSVLESMSELVPMRPWSMGAWPERLHVMTGPCGSGKTTAALRMALQLRQEDPLLHIAFINADCERGNGRLLLRHWAELSDFTYLEASDAGSMRAALRACAEADRIFIDLPGLVGREGTLLDMLGTLGIQGIGAAVHLALPPHYGATQYKAFLARYQASLLSGIVWTKLDETASFGPLINISGSSGLPAVALSYGAAMRGTLSPAESGFLWRLVFKRQLPEPTASRMPEVDSERDAEELSSVSSMVTDA